MKLRQHKRLGPGINTSAVYLKLFKDIPKLDLEMLLPGARLTMPGLQRLKLGGSLVGSLAFVGYKVVSELGNLAMAVVQRNPMAFWGPLSLVFGYGYRQYAGYQTTKQTYTSMLTESLYYQNLDNNAGVITRLLDEAEEQECRETLLAYHALWRQAPAEGWTASQLDDHLEQEIEKRTSLQDRFRDRRRPGQAGTAGPGGKERRPLACRADRAGPLKSWIGLGTTTSSSAMRRSCRRDPEFAAACGLAFAGGQWQLPASER